MNAAQAVVQAAADYETQAVTLAQIEMGVLDRNETLARQRVNEALDVLRGKVRQWRKARKSSSGAQRKSSPETAGHGRRAS